MQAEPRAETHWAYPLRVLAVGVGSVLLWHAAGFVFERVLGWSA